MIWIIATKKTSRIEYYTGKIFGKDIELTYEESQAKQYSNRGVAQIGVNALNQKGQGYFYPFLLDFKKRKKDN